MIWDTFFIGLLGVFLVLLLVRRGTVRYMDFHPTLLPRKWALWKGGGNPQCRLLQRYQDSPDPRAAVFLRPLAGVEAETSQGHSCWNLQVWLKDDRNFPSMAVVSCVDVYVFVAHSFCISQQQFDNKALVDFFFFILYLVGHFVMHKKPNTKSTACLFITILWHTV